MDTSYSVVREALDDWIGGKPIPSVTYGPGYLPCSCVYGHVVVRVFLFEHPEFEQYREQLLHDYGAVWFIVGTEAWAEAKQHACLV